MSGAEAKREPLSRAFERRVARTDGCWSWLGQINQHGYGVLTHWQFGRSGQYAHRISWLLARGPIGPGLVVLHNCDNPRCVNPEHLSIGTQQANVADMVNKGRQANGIRRPTAKLDDEKVRAIRARYRRQSRPFAPDGNMNELVAEFGVGESAIRKVVKALNWRHVSRTADEMEAAS